MEFKRVYKESSILRVELNDAPPASGGHWVAAIDSAVDGGREFTVVGRFADRDNAYAFLEERYPDMKGVWET